MSDCQCSICNRLKSAQEELAYWTMRRANSHPGYPDPLPRPAARSLVHDMHTWIWDEKSPDQIECLHCGESGRWADPYSRTLILGRTYFCHGRTPMKDTTIVNGVTLTRAQVEGALKDLNAPPPPPPTFPPGTRVQFRAPGPKFTMIVASPSLDEILRARYSHMSAAHLSLIRLDDGVVYTSSAVLLEQV